jgi:4-hydroxy-tetrahydrodipicolinate reductase
MPAPQGRETVTPMATPIIVCGAAGRMGRALVSLVLQTADARLAGAIEAPAHPAIGQDAGTLAGAVPAGVSITSDFEAAAGIGAVVLDFSTAAAALAHLRIAAARQTAIVVGATGFTAAQQAEVDALAPQTRSVVAANMSVGIAVLQRLARAAAAALGDDFDPEIVEIHHALKVDAPSGTALGLARAVAEASRRSFPADAVFGREGLVGKRKRNEIGVLAMRGGDVVGDHTVVFAGLGERLELTHRAQSRDCLARGAVRAALWLPRQPVGRYTMADVLGLS